MTTIPTRTRPTQRTYWTPGLFVAVGLVTLLMAFTGGQATARAAVPSRGIRMDGNRSVISGHLVPALSHAHMLHPTDVHRALHLVVVLKLRDQAGLDALLTAQHDPQSPDYHHYLTPQEFTARFGPTQGSVDAVTTYLRSVGLQVDDVAPNHTLIDVSGTVAAVQNAFAITLADYAYNGRTVYAPTAEPSVPTIVASAIQGITGLDDVAQFHPLHP